MSTETQGHDRIEAASVWCLRLAEGALDPAEHDRLRAWLESDPENAAAFDEAARVWQAFGDGNPPPALIALRREALASFSQHQARRWRRNVPARRGMLAAMAAGLMLMAAGIATWIHLQPQVYRTGIGERQLVRLDDGSQLSLDADTRVDVRYGGSRRQLLLQQGRARFLVAHDPLRPFSVAAGDRIVVATGTEFSVELLAEQINVVLYEGSIEVLQDGTAQGAAPTRADVAAPGTRQTPKLAPGQELVALAASPRVDVRDVEPSRARAWESGQLSFLDEPLAVAVERMNRHARHRLALGDAASGHLRISGTFTAGDNAAFVEGITGVFPVVARDDGDVTVLSRRPTTTPADATQ